MEPAQTDSIREVPFGSLRPEFVATGFPNNVVKTSKYTIPTFVPLNLFEQLQKAANVWFLFISIIMFVGEQTELYMESIQAYSTFLTLAAMMLASAIMAAMDDYRRHVADNQMNCRDAHVVRQGSASVTAELIPWSAVSVGDVLVVKSEEEFPADMVPLVTSGVEGTCYVSTANLDGETNLKLKTCAASTYSALSDTTTGGSQPGTRRDDQPLLERSVSRLSEIAGSIKAEAPQRSIHTFSGSIRLREGDEQTLDARHLLLRGTVLRNTAWCLGVVVYTGIDTRVVMNSRKSPMKIANLEHVINTSMVVTLLAQALMALISDIFFNVWISTYRGYWYLYPSGTGSEILLPEPIGFWITFFILYSNLMPISLYATIECCNAVQAHYIKQDLEMYCSEFDCSAMVRSTNLCQELGQVEYIFSDKTGTLTQNVMDLKRIYVGGEVFGQVSEERGFEGGPAMKKARERSPEQAEAIDALLEVLAVSHTVVVTHDKNGSFRYEAESPDEDALVSATALLGLRFQGRCGQEVHVDVHVDGQVKRRVYTIMALNAFTSARKRMSVVVQRESGDYLLLVKGADNVMIENAASFDPALEENLTEFARQGLRTLVIGRRILTDTELTAWRIEYERAQCALEGRDQALAAVAEKIERNIQLVGATAIEDKLQVGVSETIVRLRCAGIKIWVLTGDKLETARNIGYSTQVLSDEMHILILDNEAEKAKLDMEGLLNEMETASRCVAETGTTIGLMVTGPALEVILGSALEKVFLKIGVRCSVVIACRVSPLQKAQMVGLVRSNVKPQPVTLAVGDGANDVPMIQEAQVGVGICGREGRQAVNSADFAIAQFRFLQRLLLVHGRYNYRRTCKFTLYTFWRNAVQVLLTFYYSFMSGNSGISIFVDRVRMTFNFILSIPIIATGIFDCDVNDQIALEHPALYDVGRLGQDLSPWKMAECLLSAFVHSLVILCVSLLAFSGMDVHGAGDYYTFGTAMYTFLIIASNYRVAFITTTWNWLSVAALAASFLMYALCLIVYGSWKVVGGSELQSVPYYMASNGPFWVGACVVPALAMFVDVFAAFLCRELRPNSKDLILEGVRAGRVQKVEATPLSPPVAKVLTRSDTGFLSFAFDHPGNPPRNHLALGAMDPMAGDTSLVADQSHTTVKVQRPSTETLMPVKEEPCTSALDVASQCNRPTDSDFAQQKLPSWQFELTWRKTAFAMLASGALLLFLGAYALALSQSVSQIRIQYEGKGSDGPAGTNPDEIHRESCVAGLNGETTSCIMNISVPRDMAGPIWVFFAVSPFYQNFNSYILSSVSAEFEGKVVPPGKRQICESTSSAEDANERQIVPCGLPATSFFNDTVEVLGLGTRLDETGIAWKSDVDRFANPSDYPSRPDTSWLYERYPSIVSESEGVKNEHFVTWMRPSAMSYVQKRYGSLSTSLSSGEIVSIRINASFPVRDLEARKEIVFTTYTNLGGRDDAFGMFLVISGALCLIMSATVMLVQNLCPREPGEPRRSLGRRVLPIVITP